MRFRCGVVAKKHILFVLYTGTLSGGVHVESSTCGLCVRRRSSCFVFL